MTTRYRLYTTALGNKVWQLDLMWHRYYGPAVPEQDAWWLYDTHIK